MLLLPAATPFPCPSPTTVILLSFAAALLTFAILLSMVGCCIYARFVILCLFHYPLHTFILISRHHVNVDAFVAGCHPFLPPIATHVLLLSLPATARLHRSPVDGWLLCPLPSVILSPLLSSAACAIIDALVANTELKFHQATPFHRPKPALRIAYRRRACTYYG